MGIRGGEMIGWVDFIVLCDQMWVRVYCMQFVIIKIIWILGNGEFGKCVLEMNILQVFS